MSAQFIPHGHCYLWKPSLVGLQLTSDLLIAFAYYSIPITLAYFVRKRDDLPYPSIFLLFGAFIICCGTTHLIEIVTLWYPIYWVAGILKAITALVSLYTATEMFFIIPHALSLPSPEQLKLVNQKLEQEIEERQKIETKLRQSEARYCAILEDQTELIARFQADGTLTFVNQAYCRYFGKKREELINKVYRPLVVPEDREKIENLLNSLTRENPVGTVENRVIVNEETRWTLWNNRAIFDEEGKFVEYQSVGRDITDRKRTTEQALQERELTLRSFFDSAPMMMGIIELVDNQDILHVSMNLKSAAFFGLTSETPLEQPTNKLESQEIWHQWSDYYQKSAATGKPICFEYAHKLDKDKTQYLSVTVAKIAKKQEGRAQFSYIAEDITARKESEREIAKSLQEKEVLLKEIHHRVKNNLQVICSLLNLQGRSLKDTKIKMPFQETQNRVRAMALVHEQLYQNSNLSQINLAEYLKKLVNNLFRAYFASNNIELQLKVDDFFLELDTAVPCGLIVNELVSNAIKYAFSLEERGEIIIKGFSNEEQNLVLIVEDSGRGLPLHFDLEKSKTLGLRLVKSLTEQLQGKIQVTSNCGLGTQFKLTFTRITQVQCQQTS